MATIQPIGTVFDLNAHGFITNPCSRENIQPLWLELVESLSQGCLALGQDSIHSLYLRGSVPRGRAIRGVSDLDAILVLHDQALDSSSTATWAKPLHRLQSQLQRQFSWCVGVEVAVLTLASLYQSRSWCALLKTQTLCLYGTDLRPGLPPVRPGHDLISHAFTLADDIAEVVSELHNEPSAARIKQRCAWLSRRLIRSGFELVMEHEQTFTRDLYPCYTHFARHFPEQERSMRKALELAISPSENRPGLLIYLSIFGDWLVKTIQERLIPNPTCITP